MNRILLFLATNFAVVIVLSMVLHLLGLNQPGQSMMPLVIFAAIFGIGGASLAGRDKMINALERLMQGTTQAALPDTLDAFAINSGPESAFKKLLSTHPPLSARIAALRARQD